ncbi:MAG: hypothetical protein KC414_13885 [Romboutsia sp.]|nr:hypothetical protein [Romboutsia sp.]
MLIFLNKPFDDNIVEEFIDKVNSATNVDSITVYLSSFGGDVSITPILRDIIQNYQMKLIACSSLESSALDLFLTTNTPRTVLDETVGMFHRTYLTDVNIYNDFKPLNKNKSLLNIWKSEPVCLSLVENFLELSPTDKKKVKNGENIYLNHNQLREALKKSIKYFDKNLVD